MLKIYKVYAKQDAIDNHSRNFYDEYFGHVVIAESKERALDLAYQEGLVVDREFATVEEVIPNKEGIVLSDFNAG